MQELYTGFTEGFDIGYRGKTERQDISENIPLRIGSKTELWNKVMKEVMLGQFAGPHEDIPFKNYMQSPIGLVPKASNQTRLIFHLSYDFLPSNTSLNANTPAEFCSVKYRDLDHTVATCIKLMWNKPINAKSIYYSKTDAKSTFRMLPVKVGHRCWLVMCVEHPITGKKKYFVDKCLPFGASISCALFQKFSDALQFLVEFRIQITFCITNYLDDFLFVAWFKSVCDWMMKQFLKLCAKIGCPIALEKMEWGMTVIMFLDILLDGEKFCSAIPQDKSIKATNQLTASVNKKKMIVKDLQSMIGLLNLLGKAIVPGRVFTRRLYAKIPAKLYSLQQKKKLKHYHHLYLDREFRNDCGVWLSFFRSAEQHRLLLCDHL